MRVFFSRLLSFRPSLSPNVPFTYLFSDTLNPYSSIKIIFLHVLVLTEVEEDTKDYPDLKGSQRSPNLISCGGCAHKSTLLSRLFSFCLAPTWWGPEVGRF
jgi:hypothetical protein